jgi:hypothetical protein
MVSKKRSASEADEAAFQKQVSSFRSVLNMITEQFKKRFVSRKEHNQLRAEVEALKGRPQVDSAAAFKAAAESWTKDLNKEEK